MSPPVTSLPNVAGNPPPQIDEDRVAHEQGGAQARLPRQPLLHPGQVSGARHQDRLLHGAGLRGARSHAAALDQHRGCLHQAGLAHRRLSLRRIPHGAASRQQPHQSRHLRNRAHRGGRARARSRRVAGPRGRAGPGQWRPRAARGVLHRFAGDARSAGARVTASATSSASSSRRSSTAGRSRKPTSGCATAIPGRSRGPSGAAT